MKTTEELLADVQANGAAFQLPKGGLYVLTLPASAYAYGTETMRMQLAAWWNEAFPDCALMMLPPGYEFKEADDAMLAEMGLARLADAPVVVEGKP